MLPLIILSGPTASGKSKIALALAEHLGTEIISADSMQVYKYFDVGTAKPTPAERERVTHHLIDILEPEEEFTAFEFKERALAQIRDIRNRNKIPIMVGGTGLYLKTLLENRDCAISVSPEIRRQVQNEIREKGTREMHAELASIDPDYAGKIQPTDPSRIGRALSVHRETGRKFSEFHAGEAAADYEFESYQFVLESDRQHLYDQIDRRVDRMMDAGLKEEVESLLNKGYGSQLKPFQSIGYSQMVQHLEGDLPLDRAVYEIKRDTRHFAKRQLTWFRKMANRMTLRLDPAETAQQIKEKVLAQVPLGATLLLCALLSLWSPAPASASNEGWFQSGVQQYHSGRWNEAQGLFEKLLLTGVDLKTQKRTRFLLGKIYIQQEKYDRAKTQLKNVLREYPEMGDYIRLELARIHQAEEEWEAALKQTSVLLKKYSLTLLVPEVRLLRADAHEALGNFKGAIKELSQAERLIARKFSTRKWKVLVPDIINHQIKLAKLLRDHEQVYNLYRKLYIRHPKVAARFQAKVQMDRMVKDLSLTPRPLTRRETRKRMRALLSSVEYAAAIQEIKAIQKKLKNEPLPANLYFYLAEAHKGLRKRSKANIVLRQFLREYPNHRRTSEAHFLLAGNLWNLGNPSGALTHVNALLQSSPNSKWVPQALFYQGRIYEDTRKPAMAIGTYRILTRKFGNATQGEMAAWRIGWIHIKAEQWQKAFDQFQDNLNQLPKSDLTDKNLFWMAKAAEKLDKPTEAQILFKDLAQRFPYTYYGLEAINHLDEALLEPVQGPSPFRKASYKKKRSFTQPGRRLSSREKFHFKHASELIEMGDFAQARIELLRMGRSIRKNLSGVMWLSHWYNRAQAYADSLQVLQLFKNFKTKHGEKELPRQFWINFYPSAYAEYVNIEAGKYDLDPWLVKGLIRQESMYNSRSLSPAGARGLMQIMPKTGKRLFEQTHPNQTFDNDFLFEPDINIQLGVRYLNNLTQKHKGNGVYILITYNAGPKVLRAWLSRFRSIKDRDVFVESIPYPETRGYVKHVFRNHGIYKNLYPSRLEPTPSNKSF
ncbi:MAG: tRNA (adenosine(37)-N6)-dimethylallyltransferase MiaA [Nitrospinaceae bacterium]